MALRWEPTHVTKPDPRVVPLQVSRLKFAAFRLIPYHPRSRKYLEITEFVDQRDLEGIETEEEGEGVEDN